MFFPEVFGTIRRMPITTSALKALRRDEKRTVVNKRIRTIYRIALKQARTKRTAAAVSKAFSALDRAAKKQVIHKKTASRLKSRLVHLVNKSKQTSTTAKRVSAA